MTNICLYPGGIDNNNKLVKLVIISLFLLFFFQLKKTVLDQISTVEVNSMQQVTQLSAVVVMATKGDKDIGVSSQVSMH